MDDLKKQAAELGISVDNRWGEERLQQEIDKALGEPKRGDKKPAANLIPMRVNRDVWDADGNRHRKGSVIELPVDEAMDGIEAGALSRVK
jgi:hypothetical protein